MRTILNDIKSGQLKQAYLLYGKEAYLKLQYKDKLLAAMTDPEDTMNFHRFEGKNIDVKEIISIAETMPFFADYRTILVMDSGWFKDSCEELAEYMKKPSATTRFLFVEKEVDKRSKMFKAVKNIGNEVEFQEQDEATIRKWIFQLAAGEGKKMDSMAVNLLLQRTGLDMSNIRNELEKLFCYTYGKEIITGQDVEAVVSMRIENNIFQMITAISMKQQKKALKYYYDLLALKEAPVKILVLLTRQFNLLLQTKELKNKGYDKAGIAKKLQLQPFLADKYLRQAAEFQQDVLRQALSDCVETEEAVKTGRIVDRLGVEMLIVKYSM